MFHSSKVIRSLKNSLLDLDIYRKISLTDEELREKERLENSLYEFSKAAWHVTNPAFKYVDGWHVACIANHLEAAYYGHIQCLLLNVPSRCMKSTLCNIFFPAWVWAREPHLKFLNIAGSDDLCMRDNLRCRNLITSPWYQKYWGDKVKISRDLNTKGRYTNTAGGEKIIKSILSSSMGEGGNFIIIDDGNNTDDIYYATRREYKNEIIDSTVGIRVDRISEERRGCLINIQQRIHQFDLTGHAISKQLDGTVHLMLPMKYEEKRKCVTICLGGKEIKWQDPRTEEGELLWPQMYDATEVANREKTLGHHAPAQLQQNPIPSDGNIIKREWFRYWNMESLPQFSMIIQSWDTALSTAEEACESAVSTWGIFENEYGHNNIMLLNCWSGKLATPDLRKMMVKCAYNYYTSSPKDPHRRSNKPTIILIEETMHGKVLIDDLRYGGIDNILGFNPRTHGLKLENGTSPTKKLARTHFASMIIETRIVWLPLVPESEYKRLYEYGNKFLQACIRCPRGDGQDLVDSMAQAFIWARMRGLIHYKGEEPDINEVIYSNKEVLYREVN